MRTIRNFSEIFLGKGPFVVLIKRIMGKWSLQNLGFINLTILLTNFSTKNCISISLL